MTVFSGPALEILISCIRKQKPSGFIAIIDTFPIPEHKVTGNGDPDG
jgi:hypothetical protein